MTDDIKRRLKNANSNRKEYVNGSDIFGVALRCIELLEKQLTEARDVNQVEADGVRKFVSQFEYNTAYPELCIRTLGEKYANSLASNTGNSE